MFQLDLLSVTVRHAVHTTFLVTLALANAFYRLRRIRAVRRQLGRDVTASYSTCPVASGLLQQHFAGRSSSFHAGTVPASPARSGTHRSWSQAAWSCDSSSSGCQSLRESSIIKLCLLSHRSLLGHTPEYIWDLLTSVGCQYSRSIYTTRPGLSVVTVGWLLELSFKKPPKILCLMAWS